MIDPAATATAVITMPQWIVETIIPLGVAGVGALVTIAFRLGSVANVLKSLDQRFAKHETRDDERFADHDQRLSAQGERIARLEG